MWIADLTGGFVVLALGAAVTFFASRLEYMSEFGPGPGFLPLWLGIALIGSSLGVIFTVLRRQDRTGIFFKPRTRVGLKILGLIVLTYLFLPVFGFSVGLALFTATSMLLIGKHRWISCGVTAAVTAVAIRLIFAVWLSIPLPTGLIGW
jgi:putative tricarboxylic transport membrane protein